MSRAPRFLDGSFFSLDGKKAFLLGVNYLPSKFGHSSAWWKEMDLAEVERDFVRAKALGIRALRVPLPFNLMPKAGVIDEAILRGLDGIVALAKRHGLFVMPNHFMTGSISETDWLSRDKAYTDEHTIELEVACVRAVTDRYRDEDAVFAYDVCNEPWWMFGYPPSRRACAEWFRKFLTGVHALLPGKPVTLGTDHSGVAFDVRGDVDALMDLVDVMSTHSYSRYAIGGLLLDSVNSLRDTYYDSFIHRRSVIGERPSGCLEFGNSGQYMSDEKLADHFRVVLYSLLANGATSFFPWVLRDFAEAASGRYRHDQHEMHFGMLRADGTPKPHAQEVSRFGEVLGGLDPSRYVRTAPDAAVYVPDDYYKALEFNAASMFNAFCLAKQAGLDVGFIRKKDDWKGLRVVVCPAGILTSEEMDKMKAFVHGGGTLLVSTSDTYFRLHRIRDVLGVDIDEVEAIGSGVTLEGRGTALRFGAESLAGQFRTLVKIAGAEVVMTDEAGRPAVIHNRYGGGHCVFVGLPAEYAIAKTHDAPARIPYYRVYRLLKELSGTRYEIETEHPSVETAVFASPEGPIGVFINHERSAVEAPVTTAFAPARITDVLTGQVAGGATHLALGPSGVKVLRFDRA